MRKIAAPASHDMSICGYGSRVALRLPGTTAETIVKQLAQLSPRHLTCAEVGAAANFGAASRPHGLPRLSDPKYENNPMQSSLAVAGQRDPAKTFDTSGKSLALLYPHAICRTQANVAPGRNVLVKSTWPARSLHLSRLRGGRREAPGGGSLHSGSLNRGNTPTPTLPRKRERERTSFAVRNQTSTHHALASGRQTTRRLPPQHRPSSCTPCTAHACDLVLQSHAHASLSTACPPLVSRPDTGEAPHISETQKQIFFARGGAGQEFADTARRANHLRRGRLKQQGRISSKRRNTIGLDVNDKSGWDPGVPRATVHPSGAARREI